MIAPTPDAACAPSLTEEQAIAVLLTIAALHGGTVNRLMDFARTVPVGYGWVPPDAVTRFLTRAWRDQPTWCWAQHGEHGRRLLWVAPSALGRQVVPLGRIDRGLGAVPK